MILVATSASCTGLEVCFGYGVEGVRGLLVLRVEVGSFPSAVPVPWGVLVGLYVC